MHNEAEGEMRKFYPSLVLETQRKGKIIRMKNGMYQQIGNYVPQPSKTGTNWTPTGKAVYQLGVSCAHPAIAVFGIDTEGGDRAKTNLLKEDGRLCLTLSDGTSLCSKDMEAEVFLADGMAEYRFTPIEGLKIRWRIALVGTTLKMAFNLSGAARKRVKSAELLLPFCPEAMGTTLISEDWDDNYGGVRAPLIINALDMGQLLLQRDDEANRVLNCRFTGSRVHKRADLFIEVAAGRQEIYDMELLFKPVYLEKPAPQIDDAEWVRIRRGLLGLIQPTAYFPAGEGGFLGSPGGILGNNVISDPVSVLMCHNFEWVSLMGEQAVVDGIDLNRVVRHTIEYWLQNRVNEDGSVDYVLEKGNISGDSNPSILNAAWDYFRSTKDFSFLCKNMRAILKAADYLIARDVDDDGLIECVKPGTGEKAFGDTAYDTISSGWKNAIVNAQSYKALLGVSGMLRACGQPETAAVYFERALKLRRSFNRQFYRQDTGMYLWWIDANGEKHDYQSPLVQEMAVIYDIADRLFTDIGIDKNAADIMNALWDAFGRAEYIDSAQGNKKVVYINPAAGNYEGFRWGIPCNLQPVPPDFNFATYGEEEFPFYCNGGIFPQDVVFALKAFAKAGLPEKAQRIKEQIYKRQHEGLFENGSGFEPGVVNRYGEAYSILKWDGTPTDYEGIVSRDCSFLSYTLIEVPEISEQLYRITAEA